MRLSLPVALFINPLRGSRAFNAVRRALEQRPEVIFIGAYDNERYYRVQGKGRDPHCVILWEDDLSGELLVTCNCEAHYVAVSGPNPCYHLVGAILWECEEQHVKPARTLRTKKPVQTNGNGTGAKQVKGRNLRLLRRAVDTDEKRPC